MHHRLRPVRRNAENEYRSAQRRFDEEGTGEALDHLVGVSIRTGNLDRLPVGVFVQALVRDPFLLRQVPFTDPLVTAILVNHSTRAGDWFPGHRSSSVCPRGHVAGAEASVGGWVLGPAEFVELGSWVPRVQFSLVEGGTPIYRSVERITQDLIEVEAGDWDTGDPLENFLLCNVCSAFWPVGPEPTVEYA